MIVAFIPARGGSKRIPRKNVRLLAGRPLIHYTIEAAKQCGLIDRCIVSTDDAEVREVALAADAEVVERPAELAGDRSPTGLAAQHLVAHLAEEGCPLEALVTLQPTSPLRPPAIIAQTIAAFREHRPDSAITVTRSYSKLGTIRDGYFAPIYRPGTRSQDLDALYAEDGLVYVSDPKMVLEAGDVFGQRILTVIADIGHRGIDLDTEAEFRLAEHFLQHPELLEAEF